MGSLCTKEKGWNGWNGWSGWSGWNSCTGWTGREKEEGDGRALERKIQALEQKMYDLESRIQNTDEANQRLYQKWNTVEEHHQRQQDYTRNLIAQYQNVERRLDLLVFERYERTEDDIIVIEES